MAGFCPECGTPRDDNADICGNCQHQFVTASPTAPAAAPEITPDATPPAPPLPSPPPFPTPDDTGTPDTRSKWLTPKWLGIGLGIVALGAAGLWLAASYGALGFLGIAPSVSVTADLSLLPVSFGGKCGYVDKAGKMVINPQFDTGSPFDARLHLAPVLVGGKWGLIDPDGKYVVNPQFDSIAISGNAIIVVGVNGKYGTIDRDGKLIINPQFDGLGNFDTRDHAVARVGEKWGVIDATGKFLISPEFDRIIADASWNPEKPFDILGGPLLVVQQGKLGFVDSTGKVTVKPQFSDASPFDASGYAAAAIEQTDTAALERTRNDNANAAEPILRNGLGSLLVGNIQRDSGNLSFTINNIAMTMAVDNWLARSIPNFWVRETSGSGVFTLRQQIEAPKKNIYGFIDHDGKFVIAPQFDYASSFSGAGLAQVKVGEMYGFIDTKGKVVINPQYASVGNFFRANGDWLAVAGIHENGSDKFRFGLIDTKGNYKITPQFDGIQNFAHNRYLIAMSGELRGAIDTTGHYVIQPVYSGLWPVEGTSNFIFIKPIAGIKDMTEMGILDNSGTALTTVRGSVCNGLYAVR